jgi:hypothetical protein
MRSALLLLPVSVLLIVGCGDDSTSQDSGEAPSPATGEAGDIRGQPGAEQNAQGALTTGTETSSAPSGGTTVSRRITIVNPVTSRSVVFVVRFPANAACAEQARQIADAYDKMRANVTTAIRKLVAEAEHQIEVIEQQVEAIKANGVTPEEKAKLDQLEAQREQLKHQIAELEAQQVKALADLEKQKAKAISQTKKICEQQRAR